ncbi:GFA family protein [Vitiosangium sp. GDMCC 1.1324]|uniref:GFA family protein n=1 Tax=Vitiosangium sp. (strain GDMCC 1.1324) TaxID=2138576 RepID=UPI000D34B0DF|nr:GFA family protein [Vitiosangium sp. GDMCC 1.1324]PTL85137.1 aldehyde-activating protein [Vitiosangium sp. GDMCC 1.1324]
MKRNYQGSCHCGAVRFECELDLAQGTSRCNCSICAKTRFWKAIVKAGEFRLLSGADALSDYQFGSHSIHHLFCRRCGVKPFGRGYLDALGGVFYAVNVMCLDDAPVEELAQAPVRYEDGRHDHWESPPAETRHL